MSAVLYLEYPCRNFTKHTHDSSTTRKMPPHIPPLLIHSVGVPPAQSLTLLTGLLGATTNWLVIRYLYAALSGVKIRDGGEDESRRQNEEVAVILVSWLRDYEFWKTEARKAVVCVVYLFVVRT